MEEAIFGAGCFWGVQYYFDQVPGVLETEAGYTGGHIDNPTYEDVLTHTTGHAEALRIVFDPKKVSYVTLLKHFFRLHDPTQLNRQGPDVGENYRSVIFYKDDAQKSNAAKLMNRGNIRSLSLRLWNQLLNFIQPKITTKNSPKRPAAAPAMLTTSSFKAEQQRYQLGQYDQVRALFEL
jgi:methionine-S-sulfoxide reductase